MEGEIIGKGREKTVYVDKKDPNKILAVFERNNPNRLNSNERMKARFYLHKILAILFPNNIPEIYWSASKPERFSGKRIAHDKYHQNINAANGIIEKYYALNDSENFLYSHKDSNFMDSIKELGIQSFDSSPQNFSEDIDGHLKYVDSFEAWDSIREKDGTISRYKWFNYEKLKAAIEKLKNPDEKLKCLKYLERIEELFQMEIDNIH